MGVPLAFDFGEAKYEWSGQKSRPSASVVQPRTEAHARTSTPSAARWAGSVSSAAQPSSSQLIRLRRTVTDRGYRLP